MKNISHFFDDIYYLFQYVFTGLYECTVSISLSKYREVLVLHFCFGEKNWESSEKIYRRLILTNEEYQDVDQVRSVLLYRFMPNENLSCYHLLVSKLNYEQLEAMKAWLLLLEIHGYPNFDEDWLQADSQ